MEQRPERLKASPQVPNPQPLITLDELLSSESSMLQRIGRELEDEVVLMAGHSSTTSGHRSSGSHSSHSSSSMIEHPLGG